MQILIVALVAVLVYFGTMAFYWFWLRRTSVKDLEQNLDSTIGGVIVGALMLGLGAILMVFPQVTLRQYALLSTALLSLLYLQNKWPRLRYKCFWMMFLALFGSALMPEIFPSLPLSLNSQVLMALTWFSVMSLVIWFDQEPLVSFLTASSWALAFSLICLVPNAFPPQLTVWMVLSVAAFWGTLNMLARYLGVVSLGPYGSTILGFIMGGVLAVFVGYGRYTAAVTLSGYYLFELFFIMLTCFGYHPLRMEKGDFALSRSLVETKSSGLIRILGFHLICLALLGVVPLKPEWNGVLLILSLVFLLDLYNRYKGWEVPGIRDMLRETRNMLKTVFQKSKEITSVSLVQEKTRTVKKAPAARSKKVKRTVKKQTVRKKKK